MKRGIRRRTTVRETTRRAKRTLQQHGSRIIVILGARLRAIKSRDRPKSNGHQKLVGKEARVGNKLGLQKRTGTEVARKVSRFSKLRDGRLKQPQCQRQKPKHPRLVAGLLMWQNLRKSGEAGAPILKTLMPGTKLRSPGLVEGGQVKPLQPSLSQVDGAASLQTLATDGPVRH